jgi:hypothetical protein
MGETQACRNGVKGATLVYKIWGKGGSARWKRGKRGVKNIMEVQLTLQGTRGVTIQHHLNCL